MFTHWSPIRSTCLITWSRAGHDAQVRRHRRLQREQRQDALMDLEVAPVDPIVVGDDHARELHVLVLDGLEARGRARPRPSPARRGPFASSEASSA